MSRPAIVPIMSIISGVVVSQKVLNSEIYLGVK